MAAREGRDVPGAPGRRRGRGRVRARARPRRERARPLRPLRRARPGAAPARLLAPRPALAAARRRPLVRGAARRLPRPGDVRARASRRSSELRRRAAVRADRARRLLPGRRDEPLGRARQGPARGPAAILAFSGFVPVVDGWELETELPFPPIAIGARHVRPDHPGRARAPLAGRSSRRRAPRSSTASRRWSTRSTRAFVDDLVPVAHELSVPA